MWVRSWKSRTSSRMMAAPTPFSPMVRKARSTSGGLVPARPVLDAHVVSLHVPEVAQPLQKWLPERVGHLRDRAWFQDTDPRDGAPRLRRDRERRGEWAQDEHDNEPNGAAPHPLLL